MPLETSLILLAVFCSTGLAQTCLNCTTPYPNQTCPLQGCSSSCVGMNVYWGGMFSSLPNSTCTPSLTGVVNTGVACQSGSFNLGSGGFTSNFQCCSTPSSSCTITVIPPELLPTSPNGLKCFTGNGSSSSQTLACLADENQCLTVVINTNLTLKGCASQGLCNSNLTPFLNSLNLQSVKINCCSRNLCNSAWRATYGLSLLVAALALAG